MDGTAVAGEVRNVSAGGLGVLADAPALEHGEPVDVVLRVPGTSPIEIRALVWHVRGVRRAAGGKTTRSWGLVLGDASPAFAQLVERLAAPRRPVAARPRVLVDLGSRPAPTPEVASEPETPPPPAVRQFAIRIQQIGKPRTCRVIASGATEAAAVEAALAEVGPGWEALDARPLP